MTVRISLQTPQIHGDVVRFTWTVDFDVPTMHGGELWYRYEGIDLAQFSQELWMEVWLSVQLREFLGTTEQIEVILPSPAARSTVDFWLAYYGLANVEIRPVDERTTYDPFVDRSKIRPNESFAAGVFFGGGRDSLATSSLLGEIFSRERVLLMACVDPTRAGDDRQQRTTERYERLMLAPAREAGFAVQRIFTNLHVRRSAFGHGPHEPHLEQYTAALLPVLLARGVRMSTFCYGWFGYVLLHEGAGLRFRFERSRPEVLAAQSLHYQRALGFTHDLTNVNLTHSDLLVMRLLRDRYSDRFPHILMCPRGGIDERWCYDCDNCAFYAWHLLALGILDRRFDYSRLLTKSRWICGIVRAIMAMERPPPPGQNSPYIPEIADRLGFSEFWCNAFARADLTFVRSVVDDDAWLNVLLLKTFYGNRYEPAWETNHEMAFAVQPGELGPRLRAILEPYQQIVEDLPLLDAGGVVAEGPFSRPYQPAVASLPHLR